MTILETSQRPFCEKKRAYGVRLDFINDFLAFLIKAVMRIQEDPGPFNQPDPDQQNIDQNHQKIMLNIFLADFIFIWQFSDTMIFE